MFTAHDAGCIADGAKGQDYVRMVIANLLASLYRHHPRGGEGIHWAEVSPIVKALDGDMSDDDWETTAAIEWLDKACGHDCYFNLIDGDLVLIPVGD